MFRSVQIQSFISVTIVAAITSALFEFSQGLAPKPVLPLLSVPGIRLTVHANRAEFEFHGGADLTLDLLRLEVDGRAQKVDPVSMRVGSSNVEVRSSDDSVLWYRAEGSAIEQGLTLTKDKGNAIRVSWRVTGNMGVVPEKDGVVYAFYGSAIAAERDLRVYDRWNKYYPAHLSFADGVVTVTADVRGAHYPVVIDPSFSLVTSIGTLTEQFEVGSWYAGGDDAIAVSGDKHTVLVGDGSWPYTTATNSVIDAGRAYFYSDASGQWKNTQFIEDPDRANPNNPPDDEFGTAAAISSSGKISVVASKLTIPGVSGRIYVYGLNGDQWQLLTHMDNPAASPNFTDYYGQGVAISADGTTIAVSAYGVPSGGTGQGVVYVYTEVNGDWNLTATIANPTGPGLFGYKIAISGDGGSILIADSTNAYIYTLNNNTWGMTNEFSNPDPTSTPNIGAVSMDSKGDTVAIGTVAQSINGMPDLNTVYVFSDENSTWVQSASLGDPDGIEGYGFGRSISVSGDGQSLMVGSGGNIGQNVQVGKAYLYTPSGGTWLVKQEIDNPTTGQLDSGTTAPATDHFGFVGAALSNDGQLAVIGASGDLNSPYDGLPITSGYIYFYSTAPVSTTGSSGGSSSGSKSSGSGGGAKPPAGSTSSTGGGAFGWLTALMLFGVTLFKRRRR